jgi:hypothetical protein
MIANLSISHENEETCPLQPDVRESESADILFLEEVGRECVCLCPKKAPEDKLLLTLGMA